jgi:hypothetical protein
MYVNLIDNLDSLDSILLRIWCKPALTKDIWLFCCKLSLSKTQHVVSSMLLDTR